MISSSNRSAREDFATTFSSAVHSGLDRVLGESGTTAVLFHTKMADDLPNPAEFHKKLIALFGAQGALSLERAIVKELAISLKWSLDLLNIEGTFDFNATMRAIETDVKANTH